MDWDRIRRNLAAGLARIKAREESQQAGATTFEQALLESVVDIDSDQADAVATLGSGNLVSYLDDGRVRPGQLQRLQQTRSYFFGDPSTGEGNLFDQLRSFADPHEDQLGEER